MAYDSAIEWTGSTWNPVTGCKKISLGCKHCYAERMANRLKAMGQPNYIKGFELALHDHALELPIQWKKPQTIFVNSMSDLFLESVPLNFIKRVFNIMNAAHWHTFQVLTKRSERLFSLSPKLKWTPNIWMGVSVENDDYVFRIDHLHKTGAYIKFISIEPLLGPLPNLDLRGIDWVIVGGESGPGARPLNPEWVIDIRDQCQRAKIPFFFKQWGGTNKKKAGKELEGKIWHEMPSLPLQAEVTQISV
jgi:protein gp37